MSRLFCLLFSLLFSASLLATPFTVVIDAGHGGKDPGALSATGKTREKDITLKVALLVGEQIKASHPEVKVIYTRKTDVFVELNQRARIANKAKANLFISIHVNSADNRSARGAETYTLGVEKNRTERNLDIAKRENSVILLEDNYEKQYEDFDPRSPESYIMFEFMQSEYVKESIQMAQFVQNNFSQKANRRNRGVRQAGFLVLNATAMPSILVELGYITNRDELQYLNSSTGQLQLSQCISKAFSSYYAAILKQSNVKPTPDKEKESSLGVKGDMSTPVFKVQFMSSSQLYTGRSKMFKGLSDVEYYKERGVYKYTVGSSNDYPYIYKLCKDVRRKFSDAFIIAFRNGERMDVTEAISIYKRSTLKDKE